MIRRDIMSATGAYETVKSNHSSMNDNYAYSGIEVLLIFNVSCLHPKIHPWTDYFCVWW